MNKSIAWSILEEPEEAGLATLCFGLRAGLDFINALRPVEFIWDDRNEDGKHDIKDFGFIAQDLKKSQEKVEMADILKLVYEENPEKLEASYGKLIPILVKAIQELSAEIKLLKK